MWSSLSVWIGEPLDGFLNVYDSIQWIKNFRGNKSKKEILFTIVYATWWWLWRFRNDVAFNENKIRKNELIDSIKAIAFSWSRVRNRQCTLNIDQWMINPLM